MPQWEPPFAHGPGLRRVLALEHVHRGEGQRLDQVPRGLGGAVPDRGRARAARLGGDARRRSRADARGAQPIRHDRGEFFAFFVPSLTAMVGFWATLALNIPDLSRYAKDQKAQVVGPVPRPAADDDAVRLHRRGGDLGLGRDLRRADLGPGEAAVEDREPARDPALAVRAADRDAHHQRRRERGGAGQRLRQPVALEDHLRARRAHHRRHRHRDHAVEAAGERRPLHRLADRLLGLPRARSPASSSPTTGWCAARSSPCPSSTAGTGSTGSSTSGRSSRSSPAWARRSWAWWCPRCGRSTTTPGSSGFGVAFLVYWLLMRGTPELDLKDVPPVEA